MTVLFSDNFDSGSGTLNPSPGFTTALGAGLRSEGVDATTYVSASRAIGANGFGDCAYVAAAGEIGDKAVRTAIKWNSQHATATYMGHLLRFNNGNRYYTTQVFTNGTDSIKIFVYKYDGGYSEIASSGYVLAVSAGDVVHHESKVSGTTIESRIWKNSEPRPATPAVSVTDVTDPFYSGYAGLHKGWSEASTAAYCDDVVITDGAGGEDYFYPESSGVTITGNLGTATAAGFAASIVGAVTIACALGGAVANGHQATISVGGAVTINCALGTATASGYSASVVSSGSATITTDPFKNNTGTVLSSTSIPKAVAIKLSDLTVGASWTNQTTNGSGVLSLTGAMAGGDYLLVVSSADGSAVGVKKYTAS